jgi:tetraacyldisaccharide 4'-kinase
VRLIDRIWEGDDPVSRITRIALLPAEGAYRAITAARGWMYDRNILPAKKSAIPVVSIGNISVGGTGKTPFAAWLAGELARRGARPAVVLRGYGGDEPLVHAQLNPEIPVIIEKRRVLGIAEAVHLGATVAVLDDAFQHRSAARLVDVALLAAEQWQSSPHLLPAGPWREPLSSLRRAAIAIITRKTADAAAVDQLSEANREVAPLTEQALVHFALSELLPATRGKGSGIPISALDGRAVIAIAGIADPQTFFQQLTSAGAVVTPFAFPDHHRYVAEDVSRVLAAGVAADPMVVCTLKDAVKLAQMWPATAPPLLYVLQRLEVESGTQALERLLAQLTPTKPAQE